MEVLAEYAEGLQDLEGFSHVILIYALHRSEGYTLRVKPFLDDVTRGVCSPRAIRAGPIRSAFRPCACCHDARTGWK